MNNNKILKFVNPIRSLKLRVFVVIMLAIIIPALASSIFIVNVTTKNYLKNRIDSFKANNTMLKNNIINNNYLDQSNENIDIVDAQIEQLAKEYNCRIQVVNSRYVIIKDSNSSEKGKTCISENVIKSFNTSLTSRYFFLVMKLKRALKEVKHLVSSFERLCSILIL